MKNLIDKTDFDNAKSGKKCFIVRSFDEGKILDEECDNYHSNRGSFLSQKFSLMKDLRNLHEKIFDHYSSFGVKPKMSNVRKNKDQAIVDIENQANKKTKFSSIKHGPVYIYYPIAYEIERTCNKQGVKLIIPYDITTRPMAFIDRYLYKGITENDNSDRLPLYNFLKGENDDLSEVQIIKFINHIVKGLKWLHDNDIVHRDIRARNVFLFRSHDGNFLAKLAMGGAGSVNQYTVDSKGYYNVDMNSSRSILNGHNVDYDPIEDNNGSVKDSASYLQLHVFQKETSIYHQPPEIQIKILNNQLNVSTDFNKFTDIYQLGCTMFEMITYGKLPFTQSLTEIGREGGICLKNDEITQNMTNSKNVLSMSSDNCFQACKYKVCIATWHQKYLQTLIEKCTNFHAKARPEIEVIEGFHMLNVLGENGLTACLAEYVGGGF